MGTSVHERGSENVANYRAVTLLPAVDNIFEQLLCYQFRDKFETIFDIFDVNISKVSQL